MKYQQLTIHTSHAGVEAVSNVLIALGAGGFEVSDSADFNEFLETTTPHWDYVDDSLLSLKDSESVIRLYLPENDQGNETADSIRREIAELKATDDEHIYGSLDITVEEMDDSLWTDTWKQYYKPIEISDRLAIVPEWEDYTPGNGQTVLRMDPGAAFGTGSHETTSLCLGFLSDMELSGQELLDVGSGSGILAIAGLLLGAKCAVGVDIDELAVKAGKENAERNGVSDRADFVAGDLVEKVDGLFDIVTANIVADVIKTLLKDIGTKMKDGAKLIVSGIIEERTDEIIEALGQHHFTVLEQKTVRGWSAILCCKESL